MIGLIREPLQRVCTVTTSMGTRHRMKLISFDGDYALFEDGYRTNKVLLPLSEILALEWNEDDDNKD